MFDQAERGLSLTLYTEAFIVRGDVRTRRRRLSDVLNDPEHEALVLREAELTEFGSSGPPVHSPFAQVAYGAILFAVADAPIEPAPEMRMAKVAERAFISVPPFSVVGRIHLMPEPDIAIGLEGLAARFIPVTDVTFWSDRLRLDRRTAPMLAINHNRAQILAPYLAEAAGVASSPESGGAASSQARDGAASSEEPGAA